jgi:hypothetical protein
MDPELRNYYLAILLFYKVPTPRPEDGAVALSPVHSL